MTKFHKVKSQFVVEGTPDSNWQSSIHTKWSFFESLAAATEFANAQHDARSATVYTDTNQIVHTYVPEVLTS